MKLTGVVLTKNEENNIKDCISSLGFCDEVIVVDDFSEDKTTHIAEGLGSLVYQRKLQNDFAVQRNFGLNKARGEWVLFVDADERISNELAQEILENIKDTSVHGYYLKRLDYFKGKALKYGETGTVRLLRLARSKSGTWKRSVHETWEIEGIIGNLENPILHFPHPTIGDFIADVDNYSSIHAKENYKEDKRSSIIKILLFPFAKFTNNWLLKLGFMDGVHGFVVAMTMSFHSYLSWSKLWQLQKKNS